MTLTFLASYPRSGNTWVRVMLYHALSARAGEHASSADIASRVPDLHVIGEAARVLGPPDATEGEFEHSPALLKTHLVWSDAHPYAARAGRVILLVRDPRDVLLSCLNFHKVLETKIKDRRTGRGAPLRDIDYARHFIAQGGDPVWMHEGYGTWEDNTRSWIGAELPRLVVRYETLLEDPAGELRRMLAFLESPRPDDVVERAISASSFDAMRALEVREKSRASAKNTFFGGNARTIRKGVYFMDKARRGSRLNEIEPGLDDAFDAKFGDAMRELRGLGETRT